MKSDLNDLKKLTMELMQTGNSQDVQKNNQGLIDKIYGDAEAETPSEFEVLPVDDNTSHEVEVVDNSQDKYHFAEEIEEEETLSLHDKELELIKKSLERHNGKRKLAAAELGISERTLYRKIKQYDL